MRILALILAGLVATLALGGDAVPAGYGAPVRFAKSRELRFPDFVVVPLGSRRVTPPQYPHGWEVHEFRIEHRGGSVVVKWSSGTGDIGPTRFEVGGRAFDLALRRHDKLGRLKDDELVVSPVR